ncbi:MAG: methyltransferase domain-containing protein [bacterium]|nr:methyltransferase domain-containing protein [bacterium]
MSIGTANQADREKWLEETIACIPTGSKILDAGAGELAYKKFCAHLEYVSQDFDQYDGAGNQEGLQTKKWDRGKVDIVSDITKIPVPDHSFDAVMCIEVLEHIPEPIRVIREFSRILKTGGRLIITAPFSSLTHFAPYYFSTGFSKYWYQKILHENGFEIQNLEFNGSYFAVLAQEFHRLRDLTKQYSKVTFLDKIFFRTVKRLVLWWLERIAKHDHSSSEVLCYGLHVVAIKK